MKAQDTPAERKSMASTKADLRELRSNSSATVQELKEFLSELRGKSPQEMLGVVASSQLARASFLSVVLVASLIFIFTAIPYYREQVASVSSEPESSVTLPAPKEPTKTPPKPEVKTNEPKTDVDLAPLEVNETIPTSPNSNPLENTNENFLEDLE